MLGTEQMSLGTDNLELVWGQYIKNGEKVRQIFMFMFFFIKPHLLYTFDWKSDLLC